MSASPRWLLPAAFVLLGLIWGSSFAWIRIAVDEIPPATLVAWRMTLGAIGMIGLLAFFLIENIGATLTTMVTYIFPIVGVAIGVLLLNEQMDVRLAIGTSLVLVGIVVVGLRYDAGVSRVPGGVRE